jgi:hypothetical protein
MGFNLIGSIGNNQVKFPTNGGGRVQSAVATVPNAVGNARYTSGGSFRNVQLLGEDALGDIGTDVKPDSVIPKSSNEGSSAGYNALSDKAKKIYNNLKNGDLSKKDIVAQYEKIMARNVSSAKKMPSNEWHEQLNSDVVAFRDGLHQLQWDRYNDIEVSARGSSGTA